MERISKDAATVLRALYSQYQSRRKVGQPKREALFFNSVQNIHDDLCPEMLIDDVDEAMRELDRVGYLNNDYGDMTILQMPFLTKLFPLSIFFQRFLIRNLLWAYSFQVYVRALFLQFLLPMFFRLLFLYILHVAFFQNF